MTRCSACGDRHEVTAHSDHHEALRLAGNAMAHRRWRDARRWFAEAARILRARWSTEGMTEPTA